MKAALKCDQEPSTLDVANALIKRCQSTALIVTATPRRLERELGAWRTSEFDDSGTAVGHFEKPSQWKYKTEVGPDHVLMGWMVRHCARVLNKFEVNGTGSTLCRSIRGKDYTGEVVPFGEVCFGRNHSEHEATLNMRCVRGVFVGKLDRTDEFLLLMPTGAMKTHCA